MPENPPKGKPGGKADADLIADLNDLIATHNDSQDGLHEAAQHTQDQDVRDLFEKHAQRYAGFAAALQKLVTQLGGQPDDSGTFAQSVRQGWVNLKAAISDPPETKDQLLLPAMKKNVERILDA